MKAPAFDYAAAHSVEEAVALLRANGGDAKILAGGQSLMPMLNFRLLAPAVLVDINGIPGLDQIEEADEEIHIGALTRHRQLQCAGIVRQRLPVLEAAMKHVAHVAIRNAGTIGGSLSHADPAAELPLMSLLLDARFELTSAPGMRTVSAKDFFVAPLETGLAEDEILTRIRVPSLAAGHTWAFKEVARRQGDYAMAAAGVVLDCQDGIVQSARIGLIGARETACRATEAEEILVGQFIDPTVIERAVEAIRDTATPESDLHATAAYRRHLVGVLARRCLEQAGGHPA